MVYSSVPRDYAGGGSQIKSAGKVISMLVTERKIYHQDKDTLHYINGQFLCLRLGIPNFHFEEESWKL